MKTARSLFWLPAISLIAAILSTAPALADITLVYGDLGEKIDPETGETKEGVISAQRIYIREGMLALETFGDSRVVLFDQASGTVQRVDHENRTFLDLDAVMVAKLGERLTETQKQVLKGLDEKLSNMPKKDREKMRKLMDDLYKATELQLGTTPETRYVEGNATEKIDGFDASIVDAFQKDLLSARYYLVSYGTLGMSEGEYGTLVEFQDFLRRLFEQTPGVMRRHFGDLEMLAQSGRVPVQVTRFEAEAKPGTQKLLKHFTEKIDSDWFKVPEGYKFEPLIPVPAIPGNGA